MKYETLVMLSKAINDLLCWVIPYLYTNSLQVLLNKADLFRFIRFDQLSHLGRYESSSDLPKVLIETTSGWWFEKSQVTLGLLESQML